MIGSATPHQISLRTGERFYCTWPWDTATLLSDGTIVCGCADPYKRRPAGNAAILTLREIWNGPVFQALRHGLQKNAPILCNHCNLMGSTVDPAVKVPGSLQLDHLPRRLFVEPCISCNLSCFKACCNHDSGIHATRHSRLLSWDTYVKVIDEAGPGLQRIDFFNYGESFIHPRAIEMIHYAKSRHPQVYLFSSTNGHLLKGDQKLRALVQSGIDEITFSIDGATQETYARYRRGGNFDSVIRNLGRLVQIKKEMQSETPFINWRYILFRWNDSDQEMDLARRIAGELDIDRLCWEITDHPEDSASERFVEGRPEYQRIRYEIWSALGNAIEHKTLRATIRPREASLRANAGQPFSGNVEVVNSGGATWKGASLTNRRHITLGISLLDAGRRMIDRNFGRAVLQGDVRSGGSKIIDFRATAPAQPGAYWLQFDMVCEGIEWFESCGNTPALARLEVVA